MKKLSLLGLLGVVYVALTMMSCTGKQPEQQPTGKDSAAVDSSSVAEDTVAVEPQTAKAADKLFADFFFDFISKKKVQMNRILFPLPVTENGKTKTVERRAWRMEHFYQNQEYYTQILWKRYTSRKALRSNTCSATHKASGCWPQSTRWD